MFGNTKTMSYLCSVKFKTPNNMVTKIESRSSSTSVMVNQVFRVNHSQFVVDIEMMSIFVKGQDKWIIDTIDYGGIINLVVDGVIVEGDEKYEYFKFLSKIGLQYETECVKSIESVIENYSQETIDGLALGKIQNPPINHWSWSSRKGINEVIED